MEPINNNNNNNTDKQYSDSNKRVKRARAASTSSPLVLSASASTSSSCGFSSCGESSSSWWLWKGGIIHHDNNNNNRNVDRIRNNNVISSNNSNNSNNNNASSSSTTATAASKEEEINDADLAKEMNDLTVEEREKVFDDIHGVAEVVEETPNEIQELCQQIDIAINKIPKAQKKSYDKALLLCPTLQNDVEWKLMFLRADSYIPNKAANRIINYYKLKQELFGESKLVKRISIEDGDLTSEDLYWFHIGFQIVLPYKDQSHRPLFFLDANKIGNIHTLNLKSMLRSWWYMTMATIQNDIQAQKTGICLIARYSGSEHFTPSNMPRIAHIGKSRGFMKGSCLPCRIASIHCMVNDPKYELILNTLRMALGKSARLRLRAHYGSDLEHDYFLMTVGIPNTIGLIQQASKNNSHNNNNNNDDEEKSILEKKYIEQFIIDRRIIDKELDWKEQQQEHISQIVIRPKPNDVLIGCGITYQNYIGNQQWNQLIYKNLERYNNGERFEKTCISMDIVKTIQDDYGGRFLQKLSTANNNNKNYNNNKGGGCWMILNDTIAREKVASAFRTRSRPKKRNSTT